MHRLNNSKPCIIQIKGNNQFFFQNNAQTCELRVFYLFFTHPRAERVDDLIMTNVSCLIFEMYDRERFLLNFLVYHILEN